MSSALVSTLKLSSNFVSWRREEARRNRTRWLSWRQSFCGRRYTTHTHTYYKHGVMRQMICSCSQPHSQTPPTFYHSLWWSIAQDSCLYSSGRATILGQHLFLFISNCCVAMWLLWEQCIVHSSCLVKGILGVWQDGRCWPENEAELRGGAWEYSLTSYRIFTSVHLNTVEVACRRDLKDSSFIQHGKPAQWKKRQLYTQSGIDN